MALPSWLQLSAVSGSGDTQITITASTTEEFYERAYSLLISGHTKTVTIPVTQDAAPDPALREYLTFNITTPGNIVWNYNPSSSLGTGVTAVISYSINDGEWVSIESSTAGTSFSVSQGDVVKFKGDNTNYSYYGEKSGVTYNYSNNFSGTTAGFTLYGNINSLIDSYDFVNVTALTEYAFSGLFRGCTGLTNASRLLLPVENLSGAMGCYLRMFEGCSSLTTTTPQLPATTLSESCYAYMFNACRLTTAPALPATTLSDNCYAYMFAQCRSLTTAPALPATTLASSCYNCMFITCTSLTTAPVLPATTIPESAYYGMFNGCESLASAPALPATTLGDNCYAVMFSGCNSLTIAPELPATTVGVSGYSQMFRSCWSLTTAPVLPATTLAEGCYARMFEFCTNLNYVKCLATDISANGCTTNWLNRVSSTGTFVKNPSMSSWTTGSSGIPSGWTVQSAT